MEIIKLVLIGFVLGVTAVIPGFSVATMAVVFNVYDRLIAAIVPSVKKILSTWLFWLPLVLGGIAGIIFSSKVFTVLFENYYVPTYWFLIGVIAGCIPMIYLRACQPVTRKSSQDESAARKKKSKITLPSFSVIICCVIAIGVMALIAVVNPEEGSAVYTEAALPVMALLALAGALAAIAMIIPGISGAFLLLVTGLYRTVLQAVSDANIPLLIPVVIGAVIGLLASAAFVRFLLLKVPQQTYGAVLGLVAGSVFVLYPGGFGEGSGIIISIFCLIAGFILSFIMSMKKKQFS
ncbi:MAG: DUF368 domain-containing protein [Treponema sp.]|nr:DUF368 domain-containing protein [Treponema sp.]